MTFKTADQRALPKPGSQLSRADAWALVVENLALVKWVLNKFVGKITHGSSGHFGYTRQALFEEFLSAAYEGALVAAESYDPTTGFTFATYAERIIWRDLSEEFRRWRALSAIDAKRELSLDVLMEDEDGNATVSVDPLEDIDEQVDASAAVQRLRETLAPIEFRTLQLTGDGYSPKDISKQLRLSNGNARVILHRARARAHIALAGMDL